MRRTRSALQGALKALVQERAYEAVSITDLTARAGVNRVTFYQHFQDKDALLASIIEDLTGLMSLETAEFMVEAGNWRQETAPPFLVALFLRVEQETDFYRRMLGAGGSASFRAQMLGYLEQTIGAHMTRLPPTAAIAPRVAGVPPGLTARILASGLLGSLSWWLESGKYFSAEQAATWTWQVQGMSWMTGDAP